MRTHSIDNRLNTDDTLNELFAQQCTGRDLQVSKLSHFLDGECTGCVHCSKGVPGSIGMVYGPSGATSILSA